MKDLVLLTNKNYNINININIFSINIYSKKMKLSTLIQLMLLLILVVGVYLLFSNSVQGKMKIILIAFCFVIGSYLFFKLPMFKDHNEILSTPEKATDVNIIDKDAIKKTDGPIGISTWIYIDDWNVSYGTEKVVVKPEDEDDNFPTIVLDAYKNDLTISVNVVSDGDADDDLRLPDEEKIEMKKENAGSEKQIAKTKQKTEESSVKDIDKQIKEEYGDSLTEEITIENINIQKWVNIVVTFNNRTLDVYINGKLVKSRPFKNIINAKHNGGIEVGNEQGFGGYIAKTQYYPYFITPAKAWKIYRGGFGDMFASALNKYNLSVTFYEDNVERNKFSIF